VKPRNPFNYNELCGCDIRDIADQNDLKFEYKKCNLILDSIPYPDRHFNSVSGFDFIEHIPRQLLNKDGELINR